MAELPKTMRSLIAPNNQGPKAYIVSDFPTPRITSPDQVIIRSYAAAPGGGEVTMTSGGFDFIHKLEYPYRVAFEGSGVVAQVGSGVKSLKPGDEVYGLAVDKPMFQMEAPGWASEYAICDERFLAIKPPHLTFAEAASMMGNTVATYQTIRRGLEIRGLKNMEGMTVYITAGLGGLGSTAIQLAKKVFMAAKVITSVSTSKVPLVEQYLPGLVDQIIDYQTESLTDRIKPGSVDFVVNTLFPTFAPSIPLLNPSSGILMNMTGIPSKSTARQLFGPSYPWWMSPVIDLGQLYYWWKLRGTHIAYEMVSGGPEIREDLEAAAALIAEKGLLRPAVSTAELDDLDAVKEGCEKVATAKGGVGRFVIKIP